MLGCHDFLYCNCLEEIFFIYPPKFSQTSRICGLFGLSLNLMARIRKGRLIYFPFFLFFLSQILFNSIFLKIFFTCENGFFTARLKPQNFRIKQNVKTRYMHMATFFIGFVNFPFKKSPCSMSFLFYFSTRAQFRRFHSLIGVF